MLAEGSLLLTSDLSLEYKTLSHALGPVDIGGPFVCVPGRGRSARSATGIDHVLRGLAQAIEQLGLVDYLQAKLAGLLGL